MKRLSHLTNSIDFPKLKAWATCTVHFAIFEIQYLVRAITIDPFRGTAVLKAIAGIILTPCYQEYIAVMHS